MRLEIYRLKGAVVGCMPGPSSIVSPPDGLKAGDDFASSSEVMLQEVK